MSPMREVTVFQRECLAALAAAPNGIASADEISFRLKRGRGGRLAVTSAMRALLRHNSDAASPSAALVTRLAPRDRWSCAKWAITAASRRLVAEAAQGEGCSV
jgi:hypothetical protein